MHEICHPHMASRFAAAVEREKAASRWTRQAAITGAGGRQARANRGASQAQLERVEAAASDDEGPAAELPSEAWKDRPVEVAFRLEVAEKRGDVEVVTQVRLILSRTRAHPMARAALPAPQTSRAPYPPYTHAPQNKRQKKAEGETKATTPYPYVNAVLRRAPHGDSPTIKVAHVCSLKYAIRPAFASVSPPNDAIAGLSTTNRQRSPTSYRATRP